MTDQAIPPTKFLPTITQPRVSLTHVLFVLFGLLGGFLALLFTPQLLLVPTLYLGGLLFLGFAAVLSYRGKT
jgi:hypothetical protein